MKEIKQDNTKIGMYQEPFTLTCSRCKHVWTGENEAFVEKLIETETCECVDYLNNLSQEDLKDEINGVLNYHAIIDTGPIKQKQAPSVPQKLIEVDW